MLTDWYRLLWVKYLDENPGLVEYARQFDEFTDMFRGKNTVNCQADVIRDYIADRAQLVKSAAGLAKELWQKGLAMKTCVNFGPNCVGCVSYYGYCIDERRCYGECHACINIGCDNHPRNAEAHCYTDEL
jgi:endo-1,4-beta-D-glucanase Y